MSDAGGHDWHSQLHSQYLEVLDERDKLTEMYEAWKSLAIGFFIGWLVAVSCLTVAIF